jgi:hypothetical protein
MLWHWLWPGLGSCLRRATLIRRQDLLTRGVLSLYVGFLVGRGLFQRVVEDGLVVRRSINGPQGSISSPDSPQSSAETHQQ